MRGLELAAHDGTVLRVLPLVLARNLNAVDWRHLRVLARRRKLKAEVGWLIELTAALLGRPELNAEAAPLRTRGRRAFRFFPAVKGRIEAEVAKARAPELARRWGFWMNMTTYTFRSLLEKHEPGKAGPMDEAITTDQAAALLNVSRRHLLRLLDEGRIASTKRGNIRRLRIDDVVAFKGKRDAARKRALRDLSRLTEDFGGYEKELIATTKPPAERQPLSRPLPRRRR